MIELIIAAVYALLPTIISLLLSVVTRALTFFLDKRLVVFDSGQNVQEIFVQVFGQNVAAGISTAITGVAFAVATIIFILELISSNIERLEGEPAQQGYQIAIRWFITLILIVVICGFPIADVNDTGTYVISDYSLLHMFGQAMGTLLQQISGYASNALDQANNITITAAFALEPAEQILMIIMAWGLVKGTIEAGITYVERWLSFFLSTVFAPLAISLNASKKTSQSFSTWAIGLFGQAVTIFVTIIALGIYVNSLNNLVGVDLSLDGTLILNYAISLAMLSFVKHSEKIANSFGIRTIATGQAARDYANGLRSLSSITAPVRYAIGRQAVSGISHGIAQNASNWASQHPSSFTKSRANVTKSMDISGKPISVNTPTSTNVTESGVQITGANTKNSSVNTAAQNLTNAFKSGTGTVVKMSDVHTALGTDRLDNLKTSNSGVIGKVGEKQAIIFKGSVTNPDGTETTPRYMAFTFGQQQNMQGDAVDLKTSENDTLASGLTVSKDRTFEMPNDNNQLVYLDKGREATPMSVEEFSSKYMPDYTMESGSIASNGVPEHKWTQKVDGVEVDKTTDVNNAYKSYVSNVESVTENNRSFESSIDKSGYQYSNKMNNDKELQNAISNGADYRQYTNTAPNTKTVIVEEKTSAEPESEIDLVTGPEINGTSIKDDDIPAGIELPDFTDED